MPASKRPKPLYQRGPYALYQREGRNLEIVWYDAERKRERSASAGTGDVATAKLALDRKYLADGGHGLCPTCHRPIDEGSPLVTRAVLDYLLSKEGSAGYKATSTRLTHAITFIAETNPALTCALADEAWAKRYREWLAKRPVLNSAGEKIGTYSIGHIEGCIRQLAAAVNAAPGQEAKFKAEQPRVVSKSPVFRASVADLANMFNYCLRPNGRTEKIRATQMAERANLLRYLRMAVATWARPDAIFEVTAKQWHAHAGVLDLNPPGRRQTKKHRPRVPIAKQFAPLLTSGDAYLPIAVLNSPWVKMRTHLHLPGGREAGPKLIRRSMATLARKRIGEANWRQGEMMLGHVKASVSDIYALPDPANLGLVLTATESIIDEIEAMAPGAFCRTVTATGVQLSVVSGGKNG